MRGSCGDDRCSSIHHLTHLSVPELQVESAVPHDRGTRCAAYVGWCVVRRKVCGVMHLVNARWGEEEGGAWFMWR